MTIGHPAKAPDIGIVGIVFLLLFLGLLAITSASGEESERVFGVQYGFLQHQILSGVLPGLAGMAVLYFLPQRTLKAFAFPLFLATLLLLILVFIPTFSYSAGGAQRWISFGGFTAQPAEFVKLAFVIYLGAWFAARKEKVHTFGEGLVPFLLLVGILAIFLILQPDISTFGIIAMTAFIMYVAAGGNFIHIGAMILLGAGSLGALILTAPYRLERVTTFFNPDIDPLGMSFQTKQALLAVGSGGTTGVGIGASFQHALLPEPVGDMIFAIWSEETGFIGAMSLLILFLLFAWRGLQIARNVPDRFLALLAVGITSWIALQGLINISSVIGVLPLTGIPLPFISYGGSALAVTLAACGLLFHISRYMRFSTHKGRGKR
jgi:cell division protein FtsW